MILDSQTAQTNNTRSIELAQGTARQSVTVPRPRVLSHTPHPRSTRPPTHHLMLTVLFTGRNLGCRKDDDLEIFNTLRLRVELDSGHTTRMT
jgi:hypothetical protein